MTDRPTRTVSLCNVCFRAPVAPDSIRCAGCTPGHPVADKTPRRTAQYRPKVRQQ